MTVHTPIETRSNAVPLWALLVTVALLVIGGIYLVANLGGENPPVAIPGASQVAPGGSGEPDPAVGEALLGQAVPACTSCHGADLAGQGAFPPLTGVAEGPVSENLQGLAEEHPDNWAELWIDGTTPETEGIDRMGMPPFGDQLSPEQIASIVAYLKTLP
jgi:mono/diheme cytochrome c family protein